MSTLDNWNSLMNFKVHLIACGGTAMILLDIKDSTKDNELPCSPDERDLRFAPTSYGVSIGSYHNDEIHSDTTSFAEKIRI